MCALQMPFKAGPRRSPSGSRSCLRVTASGLIENWRPTQARWQIESRLPHQRRQLRRRRPADWPEPRSWPHGARSTPRSRGPSPICAAVSSGGVERYRFGARHNSSINSSSLCWRRRCCQMPISFPGVSSAASSLRSSRSWQRGGCRGRRYYWVAFRVSWC